MECLSIVHGDLASVVFGILIPLFLFFLAIQAFRFLFWGPRWGRGYIMVRGDGVGTDVLPPMFEEWHKQAHKSPGEGGEQPQEKKNRSSTNEMPILWWASHLVLDVWNDEKDITSNY